MNSAREIRAAARSAGLKSFDTGRPCARGHTSPRQTSDFRCIACIREWRASHYERHSHRAKSRAAAGRARRVGAIPADWSDFDAFVMQEAVSACRRREAMTGYPWHVDHLVPLSRGGLHCATNVQVIPAAINLRKHNRLWLTVPGEWIGVIQNERQVVAARGHQKAPDRAPVGLK